MCIGERVWETGSEVKCNVYSECVEIYVSVNAWVEEEVSDRGMVWRIQR